MSDLPIGDPNEIAKEKQRQDKARGIIPTKDLPGPPYICPECEESYSDKRPLGQHRSQVHGYKSPSAIYSHELYVRQKAKREAEGLPAKSNVEIARERKKTHVSNTSETAESEFSHHIAFAAGYITCFIETYAKGNRLSGPEFTRRLAEFLSAKSR